MLARGTERRNLLETVQGYVILKAATFETGHGFALGHNPGAPSSFVTWQFTEGENGHRDYYWGRYGTSQAWAQRDFDRRVDDYQQLCFLFPPIKTNTLLTRTPVKVPAKQQ